MFASKKFRGCGVGSIASAMGALAVTLMPMSAALAAPGTVTVTVQSSGTPIGVGYRWLLEEDTTWYVDPDQPDANTTTDTLALNMHKSHMPVVAQGHSDTNPAAIPVPDTSKRYFLSILPDQHDAGTGALAGPSRDCSIAGNCFTQSGRQVTPELFNGGSTANLSVTLTGQPVPTAQIFLRAFQDSAPINGAWDAGEAMLGGWTVFIYDMGGQMMADTFGRPLGTVYDGDGNVVRLGDGTLHTLTAEEAADPARNPYGLTIGEVLIKGLAPGKYGVRMVPPSGQNWQQTSTIEGTPGIDVWVKANEPRYFAEFGPGAHHAEFGFVTTNPALNDFPKNALDPDYSFGGSGSISGRIVNNRMARPPEVAFSAGHPLPGCWVGLNNEVGTRGLTAVACNADSEFTIGGLLDGTYQLVIWDTYLDNIITTQAVTVSGGGAVALGDVPVFRWFASLDHYVFNDLDDDGIWEPLGGELGPEKGIPDQTVNLRFRDGSIYASSTTDTEGYLPFDEVFPFFSWLVAEVDFARFKATGVTVTSDAGGAVVDDAFGRGKLNPQSQDLAECKAENVNPSGHCQARTEVASSDPNNFAGPPLTEGYNSFAGTTHVFEWGKKAWNPGENGGISGVVYYQTTRAENDPRFAAPETWEPGIPRVQVALYHADATGRLYHKNPLDGSRGAMAGPGNPIVLADVDNYPFDSPERPFPGIEDIDNGTPGVFDEGDAIQVTHTDSWDDSVPDGCRPHQNADGSPWAPPDPFYMDGKCYDGLRNYGQVRPAVFDGGYAFGRPFNPTPLLPGYYVVQASPPRGADGSAVYQIQQEEDKNVDFGDAMAISPQALPPHCVGGMATDGTLLNNGVAPHQTGDFLQLFSTTDGPIAIEPAVRGTRPSCDFRLVQLTDGKNAAVDFFMFTETPITGHIKGFVLNDVGNEFNPNTPNFGEKLAPSWIPVSVRDYAGNEVYHTYTDKWGTYNAIVPSSFRINTPMPSGVSPNMLQVCLNAPTTQDANGNWVPEPRHNRQYSQFCYTFDFKPGQTTYLDTPVLPIAAFVGANNWQLDCEYPSGTPVINFATVGGSDGPYISATGSRQLVVHSLGNVAVLDPLADRTDGTIGGGTNTQTVMRDFGFGVTAGRIWIGSTEIPAANITTWTNDQIAVTVPAGATTGQLRIRRSDGRETVQGVTVTIDQSTAGAPVTTVRRVPGDHPTIQAAIDAANAGDLVLVAPGNYQEMLVMTKPIQLQGWGAASTTINPVQSPTERLALWRDKVNALANCTRDVGLLPGQPNNTASASAPCGFTPGTGLFANEEGAGVLVAPAQGRFGSAAARIDGFTITGADQSGGIIVNAYATGLEISNNIISNNQGQFAAGIRVGQPSLLAANATTGLLEPVDAQNDNLSIHHNHVAQNGGLFQAGAGIGMYTGTDNYQVSRNYVCGNFAGGNGAGIAHYGRSNAGRIQDNKILFNQAFNQTVANAGSGGGIFVAGYATDGGVTPGAGSVAIERNLIQGNFAGSGEGGGIATQLLAATAGTSKLVTVLNNVIVNNVAGLAGGGIAMDDASRVSIVATSIINNDSIATAANAFGGCAEAVPSTRSCPQAAGVLAHGGNIGSAGFRDNIVLGNRAMHLEVNGGAALLKIDGFADIVGAGLFSGTDPANSQPNGVRNSLLGSANVLLTATELAGYCSPADAAPRGNTCGDPLVLESTHFDYAYWNNAPPFGAGGTYVRPAGATLENYQIVPTVALAADEGGNAADVAYGPLSRVYQQDASGPVVVETLGDYHLKSTASSAIDRTNCIPSVTACNGSGSAPTIDVDGQQRKVTGNTVADRGADEYWTGYVAGTTPLNNLANIAPQIPNVGLQRAVATILFSLPVPATDANGDPLTYRLTSTLVGMTIDPGTGLLQWTPAWPVAGCVNATGGTLDCTVTVQASDNGFAGGLCPATNCAARSFTVRVQNYLGAPTATANTYNINTMGIFSVAPRGVLANDTSPNGNSVTLTAQLAADNTAANGTLTLRADGSFTFVPNVTWVGSTNFTYRANDGKNLSPLPAAVVTLNRQIAATTARYINGTWTFQGLSSILSNRRIHIVRDRGGVALTPVSPVSSRPAVIGGAWSFNRAGGPDYQFGDTVTITATSNTGGAAYVLNAVPVLAGAANDIPSTAHVQCPIDANKDGLISTAEEAAGQAMNPPIVCKHLAAGDGWALMADDQRTELYTFGFSDVSKVPANQAIAKGILNAQWPAPTLDFDEDEEVYLTLTNAGMLLRPDLFDPHSVHFHGFPNAAAVFDGVPEASITINMGFSFTYYYKILDPGTYMYHCHVEAAEHMQMGMLGNLYVRPKQNGTTIGGHNKFVYNDADGSTGYDVEFPIQIGSFDRNFHEQHIGVQPLPFAEMHDDYPMLNGRGYPDTMNAGNLPAAPSKSDPEVGVVSGNETSQSMNTRIVITKGQKALLRISNLNVTRFYTLATTGLPMQIVGTGAHILRGPAGGAAANLYYTTNSVTLGGGEAVDVLIDTSDASVQPGRYLLYSTNLEALSNGAEDFGGMMTEIVIQ